MFLSGDIGGTNSRLGICSETSLALEVVQTFSNKDYPNLLSIINEFLNTKLGEKKHQIKAACFGIAGPIENQKSYLTNLAWEIETNQLKNLLNTKNVYLLNDLESTGYGINLIPQEKIHVIRTGKKRNGNAGIISIGTGLGECFLFWDGKDSHPIASEGGHSSFSPSNEEEIALLLYLWKSYPHVSWEKLISGSIGFRNIYSFLKNTQRAIEPQELRLKLSNSIEDSAKIINQAANEKIEIATKTMELFAAIYGSEAGNVALKIMAVGGIYLTGGVTLKAIPWINNTFIQAFNNKGRFFSFLKDIPISIILDNNTALYGAARYAKETYERG